MLYINKNKLALLLLYINIWKKYADTDKTH